MAVLVPFSCFFPALAIALVVLTMPVHGQVSSPCTASMLSSFTPCMNYLTNSTVNGTSPTASCCNSLQSLMSSGTGCMCLIATGSVPFQIPINRSLAISLPRACNMASVPLQCKATAAPIPAPGPIAFTPTSSALSPQGPVVPNYPVSPSVAPAADPTPDLTPPSTTVASGAPTENSGVRPVLTPSAAEPSYSFSPSLFLAFLGAMVLKYYY